jgi:hypothetical protein
MQPCKHTYIHTYMHTHIHTHIHTYKHTYIHTYIHTCFSSYNSVIARMTTHERCTCRDAMDASPRTCICSHAELFGIRQGHSRGILEQCAEIHDFVLVVPFPVQWVSGTEYGSELAVNNHQPSHLGSQCSTSMNDWTNGALAKLPHSTHIQHPNTERVYQSWETKPRIV